jgi:hypothetical protein
MDTLAFTSTATRSETVAPGGEARECAGTWANVQIESGSFRWWRTSDSNTYATVDSVESRKSNLARWREVFCVRYVPMLHAMSGQRSECLVAIAWRGTTVRARSVFLT